jgi:serine/threonine protein kinase
MPAHVTIDTFLDVVRQAGVVDAAHLDKFLAGLRQDGILPEKPSQIAAELVKGGLLTRFQAKQFLDNRWGGLTLGKYRVLERLGRGANGSVFLCKHLGMGRLVAVKVMPPIEHGGESARLRFEREARAGAAVDHPNIIKVFDFDYEGDLAYLVMEYVQGVSLFDLPIKAGPLPVERACHYIRQAAAGLQAIHEAGLIHRDVKPANMLVDAAGVVKLLDLGLARFDQDEEQLTMQYDSRRVLGTADYLAPEQALNSHNVDIRADLYSLGGSLYYLLAGKPPYGDGATVQKLVWAQTKPPIPITGLRDDLPAELLAVLDRLMAKDPATRFQTPAEVVAALEPWTTGPVPVPTPEELARDKDEAANLSLRDLTLGPVRAGATSRAASGAARQVSSASTAPISAATGLTDSALRAFPKAMPPRPATPSPPSVVIPRPALPGSSGSRPGQPETVATVVLRSASRSNGGAAGSANVAPPLPPAPAAAAPASAASTAAPPAPTPRRVAPRPSSGGGAAAGGKPLRKPARSRPVPKSVKAAEPVEVDSDAADRPMLRTSLLSRIPPALMGLLVVGGTVGLICLCLLVRMLLAK